MQKALVLEDSKVFRKILEKELSDLNYEVKTAENIAEAKSILESETEHFDIMTIDVELPDGNGFDFCKFVKNDKRYYKTQVVIITSDNKSETREKAFASGAIGYFQKDYIIQNLRVFLKNIISLAHTIGYGQNPAVLVEDSTVQRNYIKSLLNFAGINSFDFPDVKSAAEFLENSRPVVDIFLIDYYLADGTCIELLQKIKSDRLYQQTPVIILTVLKDMDKKYELFLLGASDFLAKPFDVGEFYLRLKNHLKIKHLLDMLEAKNKILTINATTDELTGLFNRRFFWDVLTKESSRTKRSGSIYSLMMVDIDNFKSINDTYGHFNGDIVLSETAKCLKSSTRRADTVARFGGEEFVILLPDTDKQHAKQAAEKLLYSIRQMKFKFMERSITVSIGLASSDECSDHEKLISSADERLYSAKKSGKDKVCYD